MKFPRFNFFRLFVILFNGSPSKPIQQNWWRCSRTCTNLTSSRNCSFQWRNFQKWLDRKVDFFCVPDMWIGVTLLFAIYRDCSKDMRLECSAFFYTFVYDTFEDNFPSILFFFPEALTELLFEKHFYLLAKRAWQDISPKILKYERFCVREIEIRKATFIVTSFFLSWQYINRTDIF